MYKYLIGGLGFSLICSSAFATEVSGTLSTGVSTSGLNFSLPCNPVSVSNGTVNAQTCAITCTSGYTLSGNTCIAPTSGGGWGGGWGGYYYAPVTTSSSTITSTDTTTSTGGVIIFTGSVTTVNTESGTSLVITKTNGGIMVTTTTPTGTITTTFNKPSVVLKSASEIQAIDITTNWAKIYIQKLVARGIVNNAEKYNPDNNLTRAEFLKIVMNAAGWKIV